MSLVNDMLLDLDNRRQAALPSGVDVERLERSTQSPSLLWLGLMVGILLVVAYWIFSPSVSGLFNKGAGTDTSFVDAEIFDAEIVQLQAIVPSIAQDPTFSEAAAEIDTAQLAANNSFLATKKELPSKVLPVIAETPSVADESNLAIKNSVEDSAENSAQNRAESVEQKNTLSQLLNEANRALVNNYLTSPVHDNAFSRFQTVLVLDPNNEQAIDGIRNIVERYFEFYTAKYENRESRQANFYFNKAQQVATDYPELRNWLNAAHGDFLANASSLKDTADEKMAEQVRDVDISVTPSKSQSIAPAIESMASENKPNENTIVSRSDRQKVQALITQSQSFITVGKLADAITTLEEYQPDRKHYPNYYSLLAALYQKAGRSTEAATLYQQLIMQDQQAPNYWLGLAVSLDATSDRDGALNAFRYAQRYGAGDANTQHYIAERIAQLAY